MSQDRRPPVDVLTLIRCQDVAPVVELTTLAPVGADQTLYVAGLDHLYAVHTNDGTLRWCQQAQLRNVQDVPPRRLWLPRFGAPRVVNGTVYIAVSHGGSGYTCAFNAHDGALVWQTPTDADSVDMPFGDDAVPVVKDGIVYTGTYALAAQDGAVLWRVAADIQWLSPQDCVDGALYAMSETGMHAIDAQTGVVTWLYKPEADTIISGPLVIAGDLLYVGTSGDIDHPEKSSFLALDVANGTEQWRYPLGRNYTAAVIHQGSVYVSSRDGNLYALDAHTGRLRWRHNFSPPVYLPATIADDVVYINCDGAYALSSVTGEILWYQHLGDSPSVSFLPSVIRDRVVWLAATDGQDHSVLYALGASDGTTYWHSHIPSRVAPLAVGE